MVAATNRRSSPDRTAAACPARRGRCHGPPAAAFLATLRSTIAWSHDLLDDSERRLFARLGVFAAGFSLEAAETVCAHDAVPAVLDGIASLVDKSLLRTEDRAAPALETAIALYTQLGDLRHVATAQVPLGVIRAVWDPNGGEDLLAQAADMFRELDDQWGLAFASLNLGGALLLHHRYVDAIPHLEEALEHARAVKAEVFLSNALINLGWVHHWLGDVEAARARLREAVKHAAVPDNRESLGRALEALAAVTVTAGERNSPRPCSARPTVSAARSERGSG